MKMMKQVLRATGELLRLSNEIRITSRNSILMRFYLSAFSLVALLLGASGALAQTAADSASVTAFYGEWFASARQPPEVYASFYAVDGMVLPPNDTVAVGRVAIAEWLRRAQATSTYLVQPEGMAVDEIRFLSPVWVLHRSTLRGKRIPKAGGTPISFETKYVDLLHRTDSGGRWEVSYRIWSDNR